MGIVAPLALSTAVVLAAVAPPAPHRTAYVPVDPAATFVASLTMTAPPPAGPSNSPTDPPSVWRSLTFVTGVTVVVQLGVLGVLTRFPATSTSWGEGSFDNILRNDLAGPRWDGDPWYWNYVTHPVAGAEYYLLARNRGCDPFESFLYGAALSAYWELVTEAYFERPSGQDLLVTPLAGFLLGELRYQVKVSVLEGRGTRAGFWRVLAAVLVDPLDALTGGL